MRISSACDDPHFNDSFSRCTIYLAGSARSNVITASEEDRYALTWRPDEFGKPVVKAGKLQLEHFNGDVRIDCPAWLRAEIEDPTGEKALTAAAAVALKLARSKLPTWRKP